MRRIQIIGPKQTQLLTPQRGVVGKGEHQPVPQRFARGDLEHSPPLRIGRDPRQPIDPPDQPTPARAPIR